MPTNNQWYKVLSITLEMPNTLPFYSLGTENHGKLPAVTQNNSGEYAVHTHHIIATPVSNDL
jgi:hypothetical protein